MLIMEMPQCIFALLSILIMQWFAPGFACRLVWRIGLSLKEWTFMIMYYVRKKCHLHATRVNKNSTMNYIEEFKICYNNISDVAKSAASSLRPLRATRLTWPVAADFFCVICHIKRTVIMRNPSATSTSASLSRPMVLASLLEVTSG